MEVHHDHLGLDTGQQFVGLVKRIVGPVHKDAAHQVHHRVLHAALRGAFKDAPARQVPLHVGRPQHAAGAGLAIGGHGVQIVDQLALVPNMVAGGQHIGAQIEEVLGNLRSHAKAPRGVLGIDHH